MLIVNTDGTLAASNEFEAAKAREARRVLGNKYSDRSV
jgi:hypothetical protein